MLEHAGDPGLVAEELEAVGEGHTRAPQLAVLGQYLIGPDVAGLVVGDAVALFGGDPSLRGLFVLQLL